MTTMNIQLPEVLNRHARTRAAELGHESVEAYVEQLVRDDSEPETITPEVEALLLEGLASPSRIVTSADWARKKDDLEKSHSSTST